MHLLWKCEANAAVVTEYSSYPTSEDAGGSMQMSEQTDTIADKNTTGHNQFKPSYFLYSLC